MSEDLLLSHLARVSLITKREQEGLLTLLKDRDSLDDSVAAEFPPFFFRAEISNDLLDSHFTHMSEKTLRNYAEDSMKGVAFLKGHNWRELPLGYSLDGTYEESTKKRVVSNFYTVTGLSETDDLIARMKTGLVRDVSVGFHGGMMLCDICGLDFWDCRHYPGLKYETKEGDTVKTELATFTIEDARLSEVSAVFDGSTPEAMILKAQRAAKAGELTAEQVDLLEKRYRVALPATKLHYITSGVAFSTTPATARLDITSETNPVLTLKQDRKVTVMNEEELQRLRNILAIHGWIDEGEERTTADAKTVIGVVELCMKRFKEIEPLAEDGKQYREDLIKEALVEGVRAQGNDFDKELYESTLNGASLAVIKRMKTDWQRIADKIIPAGRTSVDSDERQEPVRVKPNLIPDSAYN